MISLAAVSITNSLGSTATKETSMSSVIAMSEVMPKEPVIGTLLGTCSTVIFPIPVPYNPAFKSISEIALFMFLVSKSSNSCSVSASKRVSVVLGRACIS